MRIAVIDDDRSMRFLLERALARDGYAVDAFASAEAALEAVRASPAAYCAVITDQGLPGISGTDIARTLRALRADLPVILVSGHVTDELRALAAQAGARQVMEKPVSVHAVRELVARLADPGH